MKQEESFLHVHPLLPEICCKVLYCVSALSLVPTASTARHSELTAALSRLRIDSRLTLSSDSTVVANRRISEQGVNHNWVRRTRHYYETCGLRDKPRRHNRRIVTDAGGKVGKATCHDNAATHHNPHPQRHPTGAWKEHHNPHSYSIRGKTGRDRPEKNHQEGTPSKKEGGES